MSAYVKSLNAEVAAEGEMHEEQTRAALNAARERLRPLDERLARALKGIPAEMQRDGISLSQLQLVLRGRRRATCHPGELGAALRKLGFERIRKWRSGSPFTAVWKLTA